MAHITSSAAIFSPSVARLASSTAKDWNHVDNWLSTKFHGRSPPPFERNPETLKALAALAALNEAADEERQLVMHVEASAFDTLTGGSNGGTNDNLMLASVASMKAAIAGKLSRDGSTALDAMASLAIELGVAYPEPEMLGCQALQLQASLFQLEQAVDRMALLERHVEEESANCRALLQELGVDGYRPSTDLAKLNLEMQRKVKAGGGRVQEAKERAGSGVSNTQHALTVQQVRDEENLYLDLVTRKRTLDTQLKAFHGLPPDRGLARRQLEELRTELNTIKQKRDAVFEGLVERETPKKRR